MIKCKKCGKKLVYNKKNSFFKQEFGIICGKKEFDNYTDELIVFEENDEIKVKCEIVQMNDRFLKVYPYGIKSFKQGTEREEIEQEAYVHYFLDINQIQEIPKFYGLVYYKQSNKSNIDHGFACDEKSLGIKMECLILKREISGRDIPKIVKILNKILSLGILLKDVLETIDSRDSLKDCLIKEEFDKLQIRNDGNVFVTTEGIKIIDFGLNNVELPIDFFGKKFDDFKRNQKVELTKKRL